MERIQQILVGEKAKQSVNADTILKLGLQAKERLLPSDNIIKVVDAGERFNKERQSSTFYRILGTINPIVSNVLFNTTGQRSWEYLNNALFVTSTATTFADSVKTNLKEVEGWFGYYDPIKSGATLCNYFDMEPVRERFDMVTTKEKNWDLTVSYPYSADTTHVLVKDGLLVVSTATVEVGGRIMTALATPVKHNLSVGDVVRLKGTTIDGDYPVVRLGLNNRDLIEYYFCIDVDPTLVSISSNSRMVRLVTGKASNYYFRLFKKIKTGVSPVVETDDYEMYNLGFSENIFTDKITQYVFNEDIDVSNLKDNLGRPLSELYLSIIKTQGGVFSSIKSGIECPFITNLNSSSSVPYLLAVPVIQKIHNGGSLPVPSHTPLESSVVITNDFFYGDIVEYNQYEVKETILGEVHHRFNTLNREGLGNQVVGGPRQEGYYYKAHYKMKIREFSNYVEQGDKSTGGIPDYSENLGDGRFLWRDIMDIGQNDVNKTSLNYPFINGCHYLHNILSFELRRQDPFDNWDLYYGKFPSDPIGNTMNNKFKIKTPPDDC